MRDDYYRQTIAALTLSIERGTGSVPADGRYHVVKDGKMLGAFRTLKKAQTLFGQIVENSGYKPRVEKKTRTASETAVERYMDAYDLYWAESYKYRPKGGKGGRGGV